MAAKKKTIDNFFQRIYDNLISTNINSYIDKKEELIFDKSESDTAQFYLSIPLKKGFSELSLWWDNDLDTPSFQIYSDPITIPPLTANFIVWETSDEDSNSDFVITTNDDDETVLFISQDFDMIDQLTKVKDTEINEIVNEISCSIKHANMLLKEFTVNEHNNKYAEKIEVFFQNLYANLPSPIKDNITQPITGEERINYIKDNFTQVYYYQEMKDDYLHLSLDWYFSSDEIGFYLIADRFKQYQKDCKPILEKIIEDANDENIYYKMEGKGQNATFTIGTLFDFDIDDFKDSSIPICVASISKIYALTQKALKAIRDLAGVTHADEPQLEVDTPEQEKNGIDSAEGDIGIVHDNTPTSSPIGKNATSNLIPEIFNKNVNEDKPRFERDKLDKLCERVHKQLPNVGIKIDEQAIPCADKPLNSYKIFAADGLEMALGIAINETQPAVAISIITQTSYPKMALQSAGKMNAKKNNLDYEFLGNGAFSLVKSMELNIENPSNEEIMNCAKLAKTLYEYMEKTLRELKSKF